MQNLFKSKFAFSFRRTKLHIYDNKQRTSISGIRATIFGATGFAGEYIGNALGEIGSDILYPHNHCYQYNDELKELKLTGLGGQVNTIRNMNFENRDMIDWTIQNSNVVINLLGPRADRKKRGDFEYINIEVAKRIAEACAKNPNVIRLIHFSSAGASPKAESLDHQTKYYGEQEVLNAFPNATIFKPCSMVGMNDKFVNAFLTQKLYLSNFNLVFDDCKAKRQPILIQDIALAVMNALKLEETVGQTYELGGPHVYSLLECYEIMYNILEQKPNIAHFNRDIALRVAELILNWRYFNKEMILKHSDDIICDPNSKQIDQLYVRPVAFPQAAFRYLQEYKSRWSSQAENER